MIWRPALSMLGREAALHIMVVLMTSRGVVAAAAKAPLTAPMAKSSCTESADLSFSFTAYTSMRLACRRQCASDFPLSRQSIAPCRLWQAPWPTLRLACADQFSTTLLEKLGDSVFALCQMYDRLHTKFLCSWRQSQKNTWTFAVLSNTW